MHPWMKTEAHHARLKTHAAISCLEHYMDSVLFQPRQCPF